MSISNNPDWGNYDKQVVYPLLSSVDINFSSALGLRPFSSCQCLIEHWERTPMCSSIPSSHVIYLSAKSNYWCQWIYQFAHEYCHHLVNGAFTGEIKGLMWLEETICELASMYHLHMLFLQWESLITSYPHYAPALRDYQNALFPARPELLSDTFRPGFLRTWLPILAQPTYHRDYYNALAVRMCPLFVENPHLWKIILHFGDMRRWNSPQDLFGYLQKNAELDYRDSLGDLQKLFSY